MTLGDLLSLVYKPTQTMMSVMLNLIIRDCAGISALEDYDFHVAYEREHATPIKSLFEGNRRAVYIGTLNSMFSH